jgi:hypothetical protein
MFNGRVSVPRPPWLEFNQPASLVRCAINLFGATRFDNHSSTFGSVARFFSAVGTFEIAF